MAAVFNLRQPLINGGGALPKPPPKKHIFRLSGDDVAFEVDVKYAPHQPLGKGSYGVVCSCLNRDTGELVAVKKIPAALGPRTTALRTLREMQILRQIRHENVISIKDVMFSSYPYGKAGFQHVYLVSDLMDADLYTVIKSTPRLSDDHCKYFLFQILKGLHHPHSADVIHRDLKPGNVLVKISNLDVKICDFGLARTKHDTDQFMTEYVTTRWYRAPEILLNSNQYGNKVDMWSVGCIFADMLSGGKPLFQGSDSLSQIKMIHGVLGTQSVTELGFCVCERARKYLRGLPFSPGKNLWGLFSDADPMGVDLLRMMLVMNPDRRISAIEALKHPYFSGIYDPEIEISTLEVETVRLDIDENPAVDEKTVKKLMREEMLLYHPEERSCNINF